MSADEYLMKIISKYRTSREAAEEVVKRISPVIQSWGGNQLKESLWSGSIAKGTTISLSSDADVFLSLSSSTQESLAEIYNSLNKALIAAGYSTREQNVSIRVFWSTIKIDYTPGKRQSQYGDDHSIYKRKTNSWTKTNINTHTKLVKDSRRISEIKLCKIWRELNKIEFPSFYLELALIDCLSGKRINDIENNFWYVLGFLSDSFIDRVYTDPANTNTRVSDDLSVAEKQIVKQAAQNARTKKNWSEIVW